MCGEVVDKGSKLEQDAEFYAKTSDLHCNMLYITCRSIYNVIMDRVARRSISDASSEPGNTRDGGELQSYYVYV